MNPFLLPPRLRLGSWKNLRSSLAALDEDAQLQAVVNFWAQAPLLTFAHDPEAPATWPGPWEMIEENHWCRSSVAIGMEFTLRLGGWDPSRLTLRYIRDITMSDQIFVLDVDGRYFLNYEYGTVVPIPDTQRIEIAAVQFAKRKYALLT
jgi:hypothetical protein